MGDRVLGEGNYRMRDYLPGNTQETTVSDSYKVCISSQKPHWAPYLTANHCATIYHDPSWGDLMAAAYGNRPFYLTVRSEGTIVGVLQLIRQKSLLFGRHLASLPYFDSAGILADDDQVREILISQARHLGRTLRVQWVELRQAGPPNKSLPTRTDKVTLQLELPRSADDLWTQLKAKVRNQIRKAQRADLVCTRGRSELLREFYSIYVRNMRDLGSPPHSWSFFRLICERLTDSVHLFVVRKGRQPVAASLTLGDTHILRVPWAGSDWRVRNLCPNMLLYWEMLAFSCSNGFKQFDFGRSTRNAGTYQFKRQWGPQEVALYWQYLLPEGQKMPELTPDNPKYRFMVALWKRLPIWLARTIGTRVIGKLS